MSYLLYCLMRSDSRKVPASLLGVAKKPVFSIEHNGLAAAVSEDPTANETQLEDLVAYTRVVEAFNQEQTVVPLRYGCRLNTPADLSGLLQGHGSHFRILLERLDGCGEMSVRALLNSERGSSPLPVTPKTPLFEARRLGSAYLMARRSEFTALDTLTSECNRTAESIRAAFAGLFRDSAIEVRLRPLRGKPMIAVYFLVPRTALDQFREVFGQLRATRGLALLMSGPWPPYNFVSPVQPDLSEET